MDKLECLVGIDWGTVIHRACVTDAAGQVLDERDFGHGGAGLAEMADWIVATARAGPQAVGIAIETPHGPVVEAMMERGFAVHSINPRQLDRFRDRFSPAGAKDDSRDARVLADALRTDPHAFRRPGSGPAGDRRAAGMVADRRRAGRRARRADEPRPAAAPALPSPASRCRGRSRASLDPRGLEARADAGEGKAGPRRHRRRDPEEPSGPPHRRRNGPGQASTARHRGCGGNRQCRRRPCRDRLLAARSRRQAAQPGMSRDGPADGGARPAGHVSGRRRGTAVAA